MTTHANVRKVSAVIAAAALMLGVAGSSAFADGYYGSAASTAASLGATASPPIVQFQDYGVTGHHAPTHAHTQR